jgi:hypothetical protein
MMHVADVIYPGTYLDISDPDTCHDLELLLYGLDDRVAQAAISLTMFEESYNRITARQPMPHVPLTYWRKVPFMQAHSFVYALDSFGRFLDALCDYDVVPDAVRDAQLDFNARLPMVRKIRNSALHLEDRARRYASAEDRKKGKRMKVDGFQGWSNLEGSNLCYTIDDGSYQKVAIHADTLNVMTETLNRVLSGLPWTGPGRVAPA